MSDFQVVASVPFKSIAAQFKPGSWNVIDPNQNIRDLVDAMDNTSSLYIMASECLKKLQKQYESDARIYSEKAIERTFDETNTSVSALKSFNTRAENGKTKSGALGKLIKLINLVQSGRQDEVNKIVGG